MTFFHLRSMPGTEWPAIPIPEVSQLWTTYRELERTQWLTPAELEESQLRQLRVLLLHCFHEVPYYRHLLAEAGLSSRPIESLADFRRLPLLTRELFQANAADLQARNLPPGMVAAGHANTSGTNGVPIKVLGTNQVSLWWNALTLRDLEWNGLDPRGRIAVIRFQVTAAENLQKLLDGVSVPYGNQILRALMETGPAFVMDIRQDPRRQLEWLKSIRPEFLLSMPTNLEFLAALLLESGERLPGLRAIQAIGESLPIAAKERIEKAFGVPVKNVYSTTEAGYVASPCPLGHGLHVHSENVLVEILDANNQPCRPGETGRLVFTTLHNFLTPFLRYDIMDDVTLAPGPCPCGRGLPLWLHVEGRRHPLVHLPDGKRRSVVGLILTTRKVGGAHQFQIVQRAVDHFVIRVVPDLTWTPDHVARMREAIQNDFEYPIRVDVEVRKYLERPRGGKLKITVIEMDEGPTPS